MPLQQRGNYGETSHNTEHNRRKLVDEFRVTWDSIYIHSTTYALYSFW
jgi:hypothetical protein